MHGLAPARTLAEIIPNGTQFWVGALTTMPNESWAGWVESTDATYSRAPCSAWATEGLADGTRERVNQAEVLFPPLTGPVLVAGWGVFGASSGGSLVAAALARPPGGLPTPQPYLAGQQPKLSVGSLRISLGQGDFAVESDAMIEFIGQTNGNELHVFAQPATTQTPVVLGAGEFRHVRVQVTASEPGSPDVRYFREVSQRFYRADAGSNAAAWPGSWQATPDGPATRVGLVAASADLSLNVNDVEVHARGEPGKVLNWHVAMWLQDGAL